MRGKVAGGQTCSKYFLLILCLNLMYVVKFDCVFDVFSYYWQH